MVKSWRVDELMPAARVAYEELERVLGVPLIRSMRVRRRFRNDSERADFARRWEQGLLSPWVGVADDEGFWIEGAAQVDMAALVSAARNRWRSSGRLIERRVDPDDELIRRDRVIVASGAEIGRSFGFVPWQRAWGETLTIEVSPGTLDTGVILNSGHWLLPLSESRARVGATYQRDAGDAGRSTATARNELVAAARRLLQRPFTIVAQDAGWRVNTPDRRPCLGWHPLEPRLGLIGGLGSKGALWAPLLARQWVCSWMEGGGFDPELTVNRFSAAGGLRSGQIT